MNQLTPEVALRNLDAAAAQVNASREAHAALVEAVRVLAALIESTKPQAE